MGQLHGELAPRHAAAIPRIPFDRSTASFGLEKTITYGRLPSGLVMLNWPLEGNDWHNGLDRASALMVRFVRSWPRRCNGTARISWRRWRNAAVADLCRQRLPGSRSQPGR